MTRVLRMGPGDRLEVVNGRGACFEAVVDRLEAGGVRVLLERPGDTLPDPPLRIILLQAVLKAGPMDLVIQKTSELGVERILPFYSERTVVRLEGNRVASRLEHWRNIGIAAAKQSRRSRPVDVEAPLELVDLVSKLAGFPATRLGLWEKESARSLKDVLQKAPPATDCIGAIGPEGGFTCEEIDLLEQAGFSIVSFGPRILRAETAATALVAILMYEWGDLNPVCDPGA